MNQYVQHRLFQALDEASRRVDFRPVVDGFRAVLNHVGVHPDRIQLPMIKDLGFRHPNIWGVILTWTQAGGFADTWVVNHTEAPARVSSDNNRTSGHPASEPDTSPFMWLRDREEWCFKTDLWAPEREFQVFHTLRQQGLRHYCAFKMALPGGYGSAVMSLSATAPFPPDLEHRLEGLRIAMATCLFAAYQRSQAFNIAVTYIGARTGPRVLEGRIVRGTAETLEAGIMFCDIRNFTALAERLGEDVIPFVNRVFEVVGTIACDNGGEILKFIGDAMLIVFEPHDQRKEDVAATMVACVKQATAAVEQMQQEDASPASVGFGCHFGEVMYGNMGTHDRLDFTVMGRSVNLASRLESLCGPLSRSAIFSSAVARLTDGLISAGRHALKGFSEPVEIWVLPE